MHWLNYTKVSKFDLSALHEHDAKVRNEATGQERQRWQGVHADFVKALEVREPLATALEIAHYELRLANREQAAKVVADALAKVKEQ